MLKPINFSQYLLFNDNGFALEFYKLKNKIPHELFKYDTYEFQVLRRIHRWIGSVYERNS